MWRLDAGGDGSWAFRSYNNNVKSPFGQAALIGACTKSVIAWGHRILKCYTCSRAHNACKVPKPHACQINHQGSVKSMESEIILECFQNLLKKNCVVAQIALDGDSTTLSLLQKTLLPEVAFRLYSGEVIVDMKADDRHLNKTIKDRVYNAMNANVVTRNTSISFNEKVKLFQTIVINSLKHYFNDEKGIHRSCAACGFYDCEVV